MELVIMSGIETSLFWGGNQIRGCCRRGPMWSFISVGLLKDFQHLDPDQPICTVSFASEWHQLVNSINAKDLLVKDCVPVNIPCNRSPEQHSWCWGPCCLHCMTLDGSRSLRSFGFGSFIRGCLLEGILLLFYTFTIHILCITFIPVMLSYLVKNLITK